MFFSSGYSPDFAGGAAGTLRGTAESAGGTPEIAGGTAECFRGMFPDVGGMFPGARGISRGFRGMFLDEGEYLLTAGNISRQRGIFSSGDKYPAVSGECFLTEGKGKRRKQAIFGVFQKRRKYVRTASTE